MAIIDQFLTVYNEVFDENENIKPCGRKKCIELIEIAQKLRPGYYGDVKTGFIKISSIRSLYGEFII